MQTDKAKKKKGKKIVVLPLSRMYEYLGWSVSKYFFLFNYTLKKHPKVQNLGAFSTFFLKKRWKNTKFDKIWVYSWPYIFILFFWYGSVAEGNTRSFSSLA